MPSREHGRERLAIAGTGLIGASIGRRARAEGFYVTGFDSDAGRLDEALRHGALDAAGPSLDRCLAGASIAVIAAPLEATVALLKDLSAAPPEAGLVLDVASLKVPVARAGAGLAAFVGTHPMAGSERSGAAAASADLFCGRRWALVPSGRPELDAAARRFVMRMGAIPVTIDAETHDRVVALTSHLPQLLSVALGERISSQLERPEVYDLCGTGIRSMTRLGGSSWGMWRGILAANAGPLAQEVRALAAILTEISQVLESGTSDRLEPAFASAAVAAARLNENAPDLPGVPKDTKAPT